MSNATSSPASKPDRESPAPLRGAKRWAWPLWGLPGAFLLFIGLLLNALFPFNTGVKEVAADFIFASVGVSVLAPIVAAVVDGRLRTAGAMLVSMGLVVGLGFLDASAWAGGEAAALMAAFAMYSLVIGLAAYTLHVTICFGVAALVRRLRKRSAAADRADGADAPVNA